MSKDESSAERASQRVITLLREGISQHRFEPLAQLPRETDLAREFGVSRGALREAICALELVGVLESRHGAGTFVTGLTASDLLRAPATDSLWIDAGTAVELVELRRVVEPGAVALAAQKATATQKAEIRAIFEAGEQTDDPVEYLDIDSALHRAIVHASGNTTLAALMDSVAYGAAWRRMWLSVLDAGVPERTRREHEALVIAVETGDVQLGVSTAHAHLAAAQRHVEDSYADGRGEG